MTKDLISKQLALSGFPFQLRIEKEVRLTEGRHGWAVKAAEQAWRNREADNSGFIDLVLEHTHYSTLRLVVECKRQRSSDKRELQWCFLLPEGQAKTTDVVRCFSVDAWSASGPNYGPGAVRVWDDVRITPPSFQSEFCVMNSDEKRRPILESSCRDLLDSLDALAEEEIKIAQRQSSHFRAFYIPAIVTNAKLAACMFDPAFVSLADGVIPEDKYIIEVVPFIRFRKSLVNTFPEDDLVSSLKKANQARERTVFVVNSECLADFLTGWHIAPFDPFENYAILRRLREAR